MITSAAMAKTVLTLGAFVTFLIVERARPYARAQRPKGRLVRTGALVAPALAASALVAAPIALFAAAHPLWDRPDAPLLFVIDFLLLDLIAWRLHRAYHEVDVLWRLHQPHHLDRFLDTTTAIRFHALEILFSALIRAVAIMAFAIPIAHAAAFEAILFAAAAFYHSNIALPLKVERMLSRAVVTPSLHWVHHHRKRADTDTNYGAVLTLWDSVFGFRNERSRAPDMPLGVEGVEEKSPLGLFLSPFSRNAR
jgi:sterol desaturase/sphingolipid hydroxylase (fatty acid hydroxylase superfamily)